MPYLVRRGKLVRDVGRGTPGVRARNKFHAFLMQYDEVHIGKVIQEKLKEQGRTVTWLADKIPCTRCHLYKVFANPDINTGLLKRISKILDYNFFQHYV